MLTTIEKVLFLLRAPVTADASTDALSRLAAIAPELEVEHGGRLFAVGDTPDSVYVVLDGAIRIEGIEVPSRLAGAGELIGGLALFGTPAHQATATAVVSSRVLKIDREELQALLDEDGEFARALFSGLLRALSVLAPAALVM